MIRIEPMLPAGSDPASIAGARHDSTHGSSTAAGEPVLVMRGLVFAGLLAAPVWALLLFLGWRVVA